MLCFAIKIKEILFTFFYSFSSLNLDASGLSLLPDDGLRSGELPALFIPFFMFLIDALQCCRAPSISEFI
jgi:hypothetical protein